MLKSVAVSISKNCSSGDKKKVEESIISFFTKTIKTFDNVIYRETKSSKKEDVIYRQYVEQYTIQKIKDYINIFFRKNISRIKNGFANPVKKIPEHLKKSEDEWYKILEDQYKWMDVFITDKNKKIFSKCIFNFSSEKINKINGNTIIYDQEYIFRINISNTFTTGDGVRVLLYYFVSEINLFMNVLNEHKNIFADFCLAMFEEIKKDKRVNNIDQDKYQKWKNNKKEKFIVSQMKFKDFTDDLKINNTEYNPIDADKYTIENNLLEEEKITSENEREEFLQEQITGENKEESIYEKLEDEKVDNYIQDEIYESISVENNDSLENPQEIEDFEYQDNTNNSIIEESVQNYIVDK